MKYAIRRTSRSKKDYKKCIKKGLNIEEFRKVLVLLQEGSVLPQKYLDHPLLP